MDRDTVVGDFVNFRTTYVNPVKVLFRRLGGGKVEVLSPENCLLFSLRNYGVYQARHFNRIINPLEMTLGVLSIDTNNNYKGVTSFLQLIFRAQGIKVYEYKDQLRSNFFVEERNGDFYELICKLSVKDNEIVTDNQFRAQLHSLFAGAIERNPRLGRMLASLSYDRGALLRFLEGATKSPLGSLRQYKSPDVMLQLGGAMPSAICHGIYDVSSTVALPGIGLIGYSRDLKKSFFQLQLNGFLQQFKKNASGNKYSYRNFRMDVQLNLGRWVYENEDIHTYLSAASGFLISHSLRKNIRDGGNVSSDFVRPIFNIKAGVILNSNLGFWLSVEPFRLPGGDDGFYFGTFSQRVIAAGVEWRLAI